MLVFFKNLFLGIIFLAVFFALFLISFVEFRAIYVLILVLSGALSMHFYLKIFDKSNQEKNKRGN
jgi:hypothetical protein